MAADIELPATAGTPEGGDDLVDHDDGGGDDHDGGGLGGDHDGDFGELEMDTASKVTELFSVHIFFCDNKKVKVLCSCVSFNKKAKFSSVENLFLNLYFKVINVNVLKFDVIL